MRHEGRAWHNIKANELTRIPKRHIFIDTEARSERGGGLEIQRWRCGVAIYAKRGRNGEYTTDSRDYRDSQAMWTDVSNFASREGRTVAWCHNLAYDVRIAGMLSILSTGGWTLHGHNIASRGTWFEWRRDGKTLVLVDSFSIYPHSIEHIGKWFGANKPALPDDDSPMAEWLDRCRADCSILATAILRYLQWIKDEDLGNWQLTGNAQSWAAFRHKFLTHRLTVHDEPEVLAAERRAMWAGRCEAYWLGTLWETKVFEYDFTNSYPRIARTHSVPVKYIGEMPKGRDWSEWLVSDTIGFIADCIVTVDVPCVPTTKDGRIVWPVGMFHTTLWDVEVDAVLDNGGTVTVERGWMYRKAPALAAWASWVLDQLQKTDAEVEPWLRAILKHWSRALIGRLAMTYSKWDYDGEMPTSKVESGISYNMDTGEQGQYVQIGHAMWNRAGREEWKHSMPMITGYIQSIARVQLWDVLRRMPYRAALYCDTDSIFVTAEFQDDIEKVIAEIPDCGMRLKRGWDGAEILGPRQIITGEEVRIAGVPKRAEKTGRSTFSGEIWESLEAAVQFGENSAVRVRDRQWKIAGVDYRRQSMGFGFTEPHEMTLEE